MKQVVTYLGSSSSQGGGSSRGSLCPQFICFSLMAQLLLRFHAHRRHICEVMQCGDVIPIFRTNDRRKEAAVTIAWGGINWETGRGRCHRTCGSWMEDPSNSDHLSQIYQHKYTSDSRHQVIWLIIRNNYEIESDFHVLSTNQHYKSIGFSKIA